MKDIAANNYIVDGEVVNNSNVEGFDDSNNVVIYEVIRVINRVGMFLEDHLNRLENSLIKAGITSPKHITNIRKHIIKLGEINGIYDFNVKVLVTRKSEEESSYAIYVMEHFYPTDEMFEKGIAVGLMPWERQNPNTKIVNSNFKDLAAEMMKDKSVFEVLLQNDNGFITEGSRTNVFFVKGNEIITAESKYILEGITRKYVLSACLKAGITVREGLVNKNEITSLDGAFISGTSLKVLPISTIEGISLDSSSNSIVKKVIAEYNEIMNTYIKKHAKG